MRADSAIFGVNSGGCRQFSLFPRLSAVSHRFHCGITVKMGVKFSGPDSFHSEFTVNSL